MKKKSIYLSLFAIVVFLFLAVPVQAYEGYPSWEIVGTDNALLDNTNDLYLSNSDFQESSESIPSLDLLNTTFSEVGDNYTILIELGGDYSVLNATIYLYAEITGDQVGNLASQISLRTNSDFYVTIFENSGKIDRNMVCQSIQHQNIAVITGNKINISFPKDNVTSRISSVLDISQWKVLVEAYAESGGNSYTDLMPNFNNLNLPGGIPGYSLLVIGLISMIALLFSVKKIHNK
ncbi:MAG: hypothetical protein GF317_16395 [Candidatus Lokiarchaeota archaeon]|nr:hypothetical protein [Candidatus Lokiarchaeota archaeon]MBD3201115.1 hypothetical protein [Candidatus Lokiarchaeota archaeon]